MSIQRTGFQSFVNTSSPPGQQGMFASMNPRASVLAGGAALRAAGSGNNPTVGYFARADLANGVATKVVSPGAGIIGFVANEGQTDIVTFLAQSRLDVQEGFNVTLFQAGDFWAFVTGAVAASVGSPVYAVAGTGEPTTDDNSDANPDTGFIVASAPGLTASSNGSCTIAAGTGILTVAATVTGTIESGQVISGTGVPTNVFILSQLTGPAGGAGTYQTSYDGAAVSAFTNFTATSGQLVKISRTF